MNHKPLSNPAEATKRHLKRGGFNNKADRVSYQLTPHQCHKLFDAVDDAYEHGLPFNRYMTIAWGKCGMPRQDSVKATGEWITMARDWMRSQGYSFSWTWVQEWGPKFGAHCHVLFHVPPEVDHLFRQRPTPWTRHVLARHHLSYVKGTVQTQRVKPIYMLDEWSSYSPSDESSAALDLMIDDPEIHHQAYHRGICHKVLYMLKCGPIELEQKLGLTGLGFKPWGQRCLVYGKRLGTWQLPRKSS